MKTEIKPQGGRLPAELRASSLVLLKRLGFNAKQHSFEEYEKAGLSPYHHAILAVLDEGVPDTQAAIADSLGYDRGTLVGLIGELDLRTLAGEVVSAVDDKDAAVRQTAARALAGLPHPDAAKKLEGLLKDESIAVRRVALQSLAQVKGAAATPIVLAHIGGPLGYAGYAGRHDEVRAAWKKSMSELAKRPNITVKVGGLGMAMGWFDFSTLKEPYRLEGKKTMGLELAEQLGWELPDVILYPTGGGTGLIGMWKAFAELKELRWLKSEKLPRLVSCQSDGCAPIATRRRSLA